MSMNKPKTDDEPAVTAAAGSSTSASPSTTWWSLFLTSSLGRRRRTNTPRPPGPFLQSLNRVLHQEPWVTIVPAVYWIVVLSVAVPIAVWVIVVRTLRQLLLVRGQRPTSFWETKDDKPSSTDHDGGDKDQDGVHSQDEYAVLITGCDSGFGRELAIRAATMSTSATTSSSAPRFVVFAGCLQVNDATKSSFEGIDNITVLQMDVTVDEHVQKAVERVQEWIQEEGAHSPQPPRRRLLHAIVNNAGIGDGGDADWLSVQHVQQMMNVNFLGVVRVCKAFLPLLKKQSSNSQQRYEHARILTVTSMAGLVCTSPMLGAYAASKHAAQCWSESLRIELEAWNIQVTTVNPTFHTTPMASNGSDKLGKLWDALPKPIQDEYGVDYLKERQLAIDTTMTRTQWNMGVVIDEMLKCLTTLRKLPMRVLVGTDGRLVTIALRMLPGWVLDIVARIAHPRPIPAAMKT